MSRSAIVLLLCASLSIVAANAQAVQLEGSLYMPVFENGYVVDWGEGTQSFTLYSADGNRLYSVDTEQLGLDKALHILGTAVDSTGMVAVAFDDWVQKRPARGRIHLVDKSGHPSGVIDTGDFVPTRLSFADDHTVWALGHYWRPKDDFYILHQYSLDGKELGAHVLWSQVSEGTFNAPTALQGMGGSNVGLAVAGNRIGAVILLGNRRGDRWIELNASGDLTGQWEVPFSNVSPKTFTASGNLYGRLYDDYKTPIGYARFDHQTGEWKPVAGIPNGRLIGSANNELVLSSQSGGWTLLRALPESSIRLQPPATATLDSPSQLSN